MSIFEKPQLHWNNTRIALRGFIDQVVRPMEATVDEKNIISPDDWEILRKGALDLGLCGYNIPTNSGGPGLNLFGQAVVAEELGRTSQALAEFLYYIPESVLMFDSTQSSRYMPLLVAGQRTITIALTEETGGSDLSRISTQARKTKSGWVLNGNKKFITRGDNSDYIIVLARTSDDDFSTTGLSAFLVAKETVGLKTRSLRAMGWWGESLAELHFKNCELPEDALIGEIGDGLKILMRGVTGTRLRVAGKCVGILGDIQDMLAERVFTRTVGRKKLADLSDVRMKLANLDIALHAARALLYEAALVGDESDKGYLDPKYRAAVSRAKIFATEAAWDAADFALQIFGAEGYTSENRIERIYRDVRGYRIGEGTSEILRLDVFKQIYRSLEE